MASLFIKGTLLTGLPTVEGVGRTAQRIGTLPRRHAQSAYRIKYTSADSS